jgi:exopolysaccharide biosynthesis protein
MNSHRRSLRPSRPFTAGYSGALLLSLLLASPLRAEFPTTRPFDEIVYRHEQRRDPDMSLHVLTIDLSDPDVKVRIAPGGADPDGTSGEWQTTLMPVRQIAQRERFDVAVNASFFAISRSTTQPGAGYREGAWAKSVGWAMTDGKLWSSHHRDGWPILWVEGERRVKIGLSKNVPPDATQIVAGNAYVLRDGKPAEPFEGMMSVRHPRTVVGVDREGRKLVILTVDGRRPGVSVGMSGAELATEMQRLGCWHAINLDGGGSTTLVMRDTSSDELKLVNQPSDPRERAVANTLGVTIGRANPP